MFSRFAQPRDLKLLLLLFSESQLMEKNRRCREQQH